LNLTPVPYKSRCPYRATNIPEIQFKGSRLRTRDTQLFPGSRLPGLCLWNQRHLSCRSRHHQRRLGRPINCLLHKGNQRDSIQEGHNRMRALPGMGEDQMGYPKGDGTLYGIACYASSAIRKGDRSGELRRNTHFMWRSRNRQGTAYHLPLEA